MIFCKYKVEAISTLKFCGVVRLRCPRLTEGIKNLFENNPMTIFAFTNKIDSITITNNPLKCANTNIEFVSHFSAGNFIVAQNQINN